MTEVFVSYARSTESQAEQLVEALQSAGYEAWRDDQLPAHRAYADVIQERLSVAKAVIVLWSAEAAASQWVRAEAEAARVAGTLVQLTLDGTLPPLPFNQIHCLDWAGWGGDARGQQWDKLAQSLAMLAGAPAIKADADDRPSRSKASICVLPFANMSGDAEQEYFSDGISEDITTDLAHISSLSVVARNTAFTFKGQAMDVAKVARQLGVSHVLEGSVRKSGNKVRITAQLIDGKTGDHVWAERFDRDLTDIFAIQDEISQAIVAALKLKLLPDEKKAIEQRGTTSAEAYNLYLMARQYWITGNHGDRRREERVIRIAGRATEIDPDYARAWALIGLAQSSLRYGFDQRGDDGVAAATKALSIDPTIAEAHCPMARRFSDEGRFEEANEEIAKALRLDPDSWEVNKEAARLCMAQRRIEDAKLHFEKAASLMETDFHAWGLLVTCFDALGDNVARQHAAEMALKQADKVLAEDPSNGAAMAVSAASLVVLGQREKARDRIQRTLLIDPDNMNTRYNIACALALADDPDAALDMLRPVFERGSIAVVRLTEEDPDFDSIRGDIRFKAMLAEAKERLAALEQPGDR